MSSRSAYILKLAQNKEHDEIRYIDQAKHFNYVSTTGSEVEEGPSKNPTGKLTKSPTSKNDNLNITNQEYIESEVNLSTTLQLCTEIMDLQPTTNSDEICRSFEYPENHDQQIENDYGNTVSHADIKAREDKSLQKITDFSSENFASSYVNSHDIIITRSAAIPNQSSNMNIEGEQHNPSKVYRRSSRSSNLSKPSSSSDSSTSNKSFREESDDSIADPIYKAPDSLSSSEEENDNDMPPRINVNRSKKIARKVKNPSNIKNKGKKRRAKPEQWQKNLAKRAPNSGASYTSSSSFKKVFEERKSLPPCKDKCKLKCPTKITEEQLSLIFKDYWSLGDLQRQRDFLLSSISEIRPLYRYIRENRTRERSHNYAYSFEIGHQKIRVCKIFFKATLSITNRPIKTILQKRNHFTNNIISTECRGKHGKHFKIDEKVKNGSRAHINSIPRIPSHYCRAGTSREYIEGGKSLTDIHRDYVQMCKDNNQQAANYMMFSRIFNQEFNISFFMSKKDQCELCVAHSNSKDSVWKKSIRFT